MRVKGLCLMVESFGLSLSCLGFRLIDISFIIETLFPQICLIFEITVVVSFVLICVYVCGRSLSPTRNLVYLKGSSTPPN